MLANVPALTGNKTRKASSACAVQQSKRKCDIRRPEDESAQEAAAQKVARQSCRTAIAEGQCQDRSLLSTATQGRSIATG